MLSDGHACQQAARPFASQVQGKMGYEDFVWFILSEEDKSNDLSLEYWFRCVDLDCDGCLRANEMLVGGPKASSRDGRECGWCVCFDRGFVQHMMFRRLRARCRHSSVSCKPHANLLVPFSLLVQPGAPTLRPLQHLRIVYPLCGVSTLKLTRSMCY